MTADERARACVLTDGVDHSGVDGSFPPDIEGRIADAILAAVAEEREAAAAICEAEAQERVTPYGNTPPVAALEVFVGLRRAATLIRARGEARP